jgi:hypothetical protein
MPTRRSFVIAAALFLTACGSPSPSAVSTTASPPATADPFMGVPERIATTPFPAVPLSEQPDPNFAFSIGYGACTITRILDTFTNTLSQHSMDGSSAITIAFHLTADERVAVYQAIKTINLFGYPDVYTIPVPDTTPRIIPEPHSRYELVLRNGTLNKTITWEDSISRPIAVEADQLRGFIASIKTLVASHHEMTQLPPLNEACA